MLHVEPPGDDAYASLIDRWASGEGPDPPLRPADVPPFRRLFSRRGLLKHRALGPAVAQDLLRYLRRRAGGGEAVAEALSLYLLPQLEGLDREPAVRTFELLHEVLTGWAPAESVQSFRARYAELFPHVQLPAEP